MAGFRWRFLAPPLVLALVLLALSRATGPHLWLSVLGIVATAVVAGVAVTALYRERRHASPHSTGSVGDRHPSPAVLIGREQEIDDLVGLHDRVRRERAEKSMARPVVLLLCGVAGVGKSALAAAAATAILAKDSPYRTGPVTVNLNSGGEPVAAGHVLGALLRQLKWGGPIPPETPARVKIFRALAAERRPLIILDAVADYAQVAGLIPNSARCCVIITSRRNLGPALGVEPYEVRPLRRPSSLELLHAISRTTPYTGLVCADRLVDISGGLPVAIRAIGERVIFENKSLCDINATLRPARTRLQELTRGSTAVIDGIAEEFERLSPDEAHALCLLTLLKTRTFASWVVAPLLDVSPLAGEPVVTELVNARLIEPAGRDQRFGLPRYRMNAIVRLYAESRLSSDAELLGECHAALRRLRDVFCVAGARLAGYPLAGAAWTDAVRRWIPKPRAARPDGADDAWVRAELLSLADAARGLQAEDPVLTWRLCGRFGENFPESGEHLPPAQWAADLSVTLDNAARAARDAVQYEAELDVRVSEVNLHSGTGHFPHAERVLARIESIIGGLPAGDGRRHALDQAATAGLILAQGYLQAFRRHPAQATLARVGRLLRPQSAT
ncbi:MAG TPA: NB-ARC domain-containing protein, partial [Actinoplanes sp.]